MIVRPLLLALALAAAPVAAQDAPPAPSLTLPQQTALRCSAAFAVVSVLQARGEGSEFPQLGTRGREFFVRVSAQLMDDTGMTREQVGAALAAQAQQLQDRAALSAAMPPCVLLLDASGIK
jgi:hypothetical protein